MKRTALLVLGAWLFSALAAAQAPDLVGEYMATPFVEDGKPVRLELLVRKPHGPGPFPTVVFNHGSTGRGDNPDLFKRSWTSAAAANFFVERGWMVIFPQRRGRGGSEGRYDEGFEPDRSRYSCQLGHSLPGVDRAIQDLDVVMAHIRARSDVVQSRILLAGQSRGGSFQSPMRASVRMPHWRHQLRWWLDGRSVHKRNPDQYGNIQAWRKVPSPNALALRRIRPLLCLVAQQGQL